MLANASWYSVRFMLRRIATAGAIALSATLLAQTVADTYREPAEKLIDAALADAEAYTKLSYLCDRIGNRLSGSAALDKAIGWAAQQMKSDGLENVVTPNVKVP